ncbi:MAG: DUF3300 domain-containing protein [Burkholderiales bacterium]
MAKRPFRWLRSLALLAVLALPPLAYAQAGGAAFGKEQIDQLTAQIALDPDSLLSQVLMAATYPADVAEAATWSRAQPPTSCARGASAATSST